MSLQSLSARSSQAGSDSCLCECCINEIICTSRQLNRTGPGSKLDHRLPLLSNYPHTPDTSRGKAYTRTTLNSKSREGCAIWLLPAPVVCLPPSTTPSSQALHPWEAPSWLPTPGHKTYNLSILLWNLVSCNTLLSALWTEINTRKIVIMCSAAGRLWSLWKTLASATPCGHAIKGPWPCFISFIGKGAGIKKCVTMFSMLQTMKKFNELCNPQKKSIHHHAPNREGLCNICACLLLHTISYSLPC